MKKVRAPPVEKSLCDHTEHFFYTCHPLRRFKYSVFGHSEHALFARLRFHCVRGAMCHYQVFYCGGQRKHFVNPNPPAVAGRTGARRLRSVERNIFPAHVFINRLFFLEGFENCLRIHLPPELRLFITRELVLFFLRTKSSHKSLTNDDAQCRNKEEWLNAHIEETRRRCGGGISVKR